MSHFRFLFLALLISIAQDTLARSADELLIVDCLLPGQIRKLGQRITYLTARQAIKTSANSTAVFCRMIRQYSSNVRLISPAFNVSRAMALA